MKIVPSNELPKHMMTDFFAKHWGSSEMVISSGIFLQSLIPRIIERLV
ncbi:acetyltransferase [Bacillus tequilensis]|nr:acetyltransferase [Bacillus tequilensis]